MDCGDHARFGTERFAHGDCRNDVAVVSNPHEQAVNDGESEWQEDIECGAFTKNGLDFHLATKSFDVSFDNIHADTSA